MRYVIAFLLVLFAGGLFGQTRPDLQPQITDPADTDAFYTQERGALNKVFLNVLRKYYAANVQDTVKAYTPGVDTIPLADYVSVIMGADSNRYYVDGVGNYVALGGSGGGGGGGTVETVSTGFGIDVNSADPANPILSADTTELATQSDISGFVDGSLLPDRSITNELQTISKAGSTVTLSDGGGFFNDDNTQLNESQVDAFVSNNGYLTSELDGSTTNEIQDLTTTSGGDPSLQLSDGGGSIQLIGGVNTTVNGDSGSGTVTITATGGAGADGNSYVNAATVTGTTTKTLTLERTDGLPDIVETFTDLNTQLGESQVDAFVANNGYLTSEVDGSITNELQLLSVANGPDPLVSLSDGGSNFQVIAGANTTATGDATARTVTIETDLNPGAIGSILTSRGDSTVWDTIVQNSNTTLLRHSASRSKLCNITEGNNDSLVVLLIGDSQVSRIESYTAPMKRYSWDQYGYKGTGWHSASIENSAPYGAFFVGTGTLDDQGYNEDGGGLIDDKLVMSIGSRREFRSIDNFEGGLSNQVDLYYELGTGDFTVTSNTGYSNAVENSTGTGMGILRIPFATINEHQVYVDANEEGVELYGINRYVRNASGVMVHKASANGYSLYRMEELVTLPRHRAIVQDLDPDLIIIALGTNFAGRTFQAGNPTDPQAMAGNMDSIVSAYRALLPNVEIIHFGHADKGINVSEPAFVYSMREYDDAFYKNAVKENYSYMSFYKHHGRFEDMLAAGVLEDNVHYSTFGALTHRKWMNEAVLGDCAPDTTAMAQTLASEGLLVETNIVKLGREKNNVAQTAELTANREITGPTGRYLGLSNGLGLNIAPAFRTPLNGSYLYVENQANTIATAYITGGSVYTLGAISTGTASAVYARSNGTGVAGQFRLGDGTAPAASSPVASFLKFKAPSGLNSMFLLSTDLVGSRQNGDGLYLPFSVDGNEISRIGGRVNNSAGNVYETFMQVKAVNGSFVTPLALRGTATSAEAIMSNSSFTGYVKDNAGNVATTGQVPIGNASGGFDWGAAPGASGDNLGNHTMTTDLITGSNLTRFSAGATLQTSHTTNSFQILSDGFGGDWTFDDEAVVMPATTNQQFVNNSFYIKSFTEYGLDKVRPYLYAQDDKFAGVGGILPSSETQIVTERDFYIRRKLIDATQNDITTTADPAEPIDSLAFSGIPAGHYRYTATIYHSKDAGASTARSDFEFAITGSFDSGNVRWLTTDDPVMTAARNATGSYTGTAYPGTSVYATTLELDIQFTVSGGSITPEIEGEITSGSHDFINVHENSHATLERLN